jgi:hypothetical protein
MTHNTVQASAAAFCHERDAPSNLNSKSHSDTKIIESLRLKRLCYGLTKPPATYCRTSRAGPTIHVYQPASPKNQQDLLPLLQHDQCNCPTDGEQGASGFEDAFAATLLLQCCMQHPHDRKDAPGWIGPRSGAMVDPGEDMSGQRTEKSCWRWQYTPWLFLSSSSDSSFIFKRMKPPSAPDPGLNISKYLSMGTASRTSLMKMPQAVITLVLFFEPDVFSRHSRSLSSLAVSCTSLQNNDWL